MRFLFVWLAFGSLVVHAADALKDPNFFPLAVWLQSPSNADKYRAAGINTYVGLWRGPTEDQISKLKAAGMKIVCAQNETGLAHKEDSAIIGWLQEDEPDNAQSLGEGKGYGPPVLPARTIEIYEAMKKKDPSRPILLNLGQGVAWDNWIGRGVRRNHAEDYADYVKGGDIVSFDIYPATHDHPDVKGKLEFVARGVERLKSWAGPERLVWNCVEAKIGDGDARVTPNQLRSEVWMSIIHGSRGIIYFVHQFKPVFREASLFDDADLLRAFTDLNMQIAQLAPILNGEEVKVTVTTKPEGGPIAAMARKHGGDLYIFSVAMSGRQAWGTIRVEGLDGDVEAVDEGRRMHNVKGDFPVALNAYQARIFRVVKKS